MWEKRKLRDELILTREICSHTRRGERSSVFSFRWLTLIWTTAVGALHRRPLETICRNRHIILVPRLDCTYYLTHLVTGKGAQIAQQVHRWPAMRALPGQGALGQVTEQGRARGLAQALKRAQ